MESLRNAYDFGTNSLFDFKKELESLFCKIDPTIGIRLSQIIENHQNYVNGLHKKYEEFRRDAHQTKSKSSGNEDLKEHTNESGLTSSQFGSPSIQIPPSPFDSEIKKSIDNIPAILSDCFFVNDDERFKCGIMQCGQIMKPKDIDAHLKTHNPNQPFICVHCKTNVGYCREKVIHHLYMHCQYLYYCDKCGYNLSSQMLMILHFLKKHLDVDVQFWYKEQIKNEITLVKLTYLCNECDIQIRVTRDLVKHFYNYHDSQMIDFKVSVNYNNQSTDKYFVRRCFHCARCNASSYATKSQLIQHHRNEHPFDELNIKLSNLKLFATHRMSTHQIQIYAANNARNDRNIIFHCGNCNENGADLFSNIHEIYNHWNEKHMRMDFKFGINHLIGCHYCKYVSSFREMKMHQKNVHQQHSFAVKSFLNPEKCGICNERVGDIAEHCEKEHEMLKYTKIIDPIYMADDLLYELSTFHCDLNSIQHSISGCCSEKLPTKMNGLLYHIICHLKPINCTRCSFSSSDGLKFAKHNCVQASDNILTRFRRNLHDIFFDTRYVFKSGLIVTLANLIGTGYDNDQSFAFDVFINELMNMHKLGAKYCPNNTD